MAKNLAIKLSDPVATSATIKYARIDNNSNPTYTNVSPNPTVTPEVKTITVFTNKPDGQYRIVATPIRPDGIKCDEQVLITPACAAPLSIYAHFDGSGNIVVQWNTDALIPKTRIKINYPNGGSTVQDFVNSSSSMSVTINPPVGITGTFTISAQSICNANSMFLSAFTSSVSISNSDDGGGGGGGDEEEGTYQVLVENNTTDLYIDSMSGIPGTNFLNIAPESGVSGVRSGSTSAIYLYFDDGHSSGKSATLYLNNVKFSCKNLGASGTAFLIPLGIQGSSDIYITIDNGLCS